MTDRLAEIEQFFNIYATLSLAQSEWLIAEVKRLRGVKRYCWCGADFLRCDQRSESGQQS